MVFNNDFIVFFMTLISSSLNMKVFYVNVYNKGVKSIKSIFIHIVWISNTLLSKHITKLDANIKNQHMILSDGDNKQKASCCSAFWVPQ